MKWAVLFSYRKFSYPVLCFLMVTELQDCKDELSVRISLRLWERINCLLFYTPPHHTHKLFLHYPHHTVMICLYDYLLYSEPRQG